MKNILYIYPTSRAVRLKKEEFLEKNSFLPKILTISEFESKVLTTPYKIIDSSHRMLYLKKAASLDKFNKFFLDKSLIKFYTQSNDFFKFFEEIALEKVSIKDLYLSDTYAEFSRDLELLEELLKEYKKILKANNYTDRIFLVNEYSINWDFLDNFDEIFLNLEGFLTKFELELFSKIASKKNFFINIRTNAFNKKIQKEFSNLEIDLDNNSSITFNFSTKEIITTKKLTSNFNNVEIIPCSENLEQIAIAMAKIEEFVKNGTDPKKIALITPNEDISTLINQLDRKNNFNFAMGINFIYHKSSIFLRMINNFFKNDKLSKEFLENRGFNFDLLNKIDNSKIEVESFFNILKELKLPLYNSDNFLEELDKLNLLKKFYNFKKIFRNYKFNFKEWLFLWLDIIKNHTLDDINGGKVTVLGVLESRGVEFEAVVIIDFNEGSVPSIVNKDRFLNSEVRAKASLPTKMDRENLQKYYYSRILETSKKVIITYIQNDESSPSKFLYELDLENKILKYEAPIEIFYPKDSNFNIKAHLEDKELAFNAKNEIWSNSKLKTFLECKRKFYYQYVLKIKPPQDSSKNDGVILHSILAKLFNKKRTFNTLEELRKNFLMQLYEYDNSQGFIFKSRLWSKLIDNFFQIQIEHFNQGWMIKEVEKKERGYILDLQFEGRVDRIDKRGEEVLVIDYKSSSTTNYNKKNIDKMTDFQMNIYQRIFALDSRANFAYINILDNKGFDFLVEKEKKEEKLLEYIEYLKSLKSFTTNRCDDLQLCRGCPYSLMCHRGDYL